MDDYPYVTLGADGWFCCDGLHRPSFPTLLLDVLHRFGNMGIPTHHGCSYRQFRLGRYKVHMYILAHPTDPPMMAWFTTARGDDLNDTLERAAHQALAKFYEHHMPVLGDTTITLLPVQHEGNAMWSERVVAIGDPKLPTHHAGWALTAHYSQHVSSLLQEVTATGAHLCLRLEEYAGQVKAQNRALKDIQKGKRELLQKNAHFEMHVKELSDQLMRTYHSCDFKADDLDDTHTRLQHAQDELSIIQSYVHHLEIELHGRHEQLEASQAQAVDWQHEVEHL
jgi:hypothetical protein